MLELFIERGSLPFYAKDVFDFELQICGSRVQKEKNKPSNLNSYVAQNPLYVHP